MLTDGVRRADEDNPGGYYEFEAVKQIDRDHSWLERAVGKAVKMVYRLLYDLVDDYDYKIVFMQRNLDEVLRSQQTMLRRHGVEEEGPSDDQMKGFFERQLREVDGYLRARRNYAVQYVSYNELLKSPEAALGDVNRFLGGALDVHAMSDVIDGNLYRNRE